MLKMPDTQGCSTEIAESRVFPLRATVESIRRQIRGAFAARDPWCGCPEQLSSRPPVIEKHRGDGPITSHKTQQPSTHPPPPRRRGHLTRSRWRGPIRLLASPAPTTRSSPRLDQHVLDPGHPCIARNPILRTRAKSAPCSIHGLHSAPFSTPSHASSARPSPMFRFPGKRLANPCPPRMLGLGLGPCRASPWPKRTGGPQPGPIGEFHFRGPPKTRARALVQQQACGVGLRNIRFSGLSPRAAPSSLPALSSFGLF